MLGFLTFQFFEIIGRLNDTVADTTKIVSNMESIIRISLKKKQCIWGEINQELGWYQVYLSRLVFIYLYEFLFLTKFKLIMRPTKNNMSLKNVTKTYVFVFKL